MIGIILTVISAVASIICVIYSIHNDKQDKKFYSEIRDYVKEINKAQQLNNVYKSSDEEW